MMWFMAAMVLANVGGNMYGPLLPLYLKSLNASVLQVGLFFTLSQIVPLALQILGGWISDSLGRLRSIAMGSVAGVFSYVGLILAPTWQWVLLGEGLSSITRSLVAPSFNAFIAEESAEKNRARVFGITETIFIVVNIIGPPLGGWLADTYGFKIMLAWAGGLYFVATVIRIAMARAAARSREVKTQKLTVASLKSNLGLMTGMVLAGGVAHLDPAHRRSAGRSLHDVFHPDADLPAGHWRALHPADRLARVDLRDLYDAGNPASRLAGGQEERTIGNCPGFCARIRWPDDLPAGGGLCWVRRGLGCAGAGGRFDVAGL